MVTSTAASPDGSGVGLGYVRLAHASEGVVLPVEDGTFSVELVGPSIHPACAGALGANGVGAG